MAKNNWLNCQRKNEQLYGALKRLDRQIEWPAKFTAGFVAGSGSLLIGFGVAMTGPMGRCARKLTKLTGGSLFSD